MATITANREHLHGLAAVVELEFEAACEATDRDRLRELLSVANEQLRWGQDEPMRKITVELSPSLRARLLSLAQQVGHKRLAENHRDRARGVRVDRRREREALSMLALYEHNQRAAS